MIEGTAKDFILSAAYDLLTGGHVNPKDRVHVAWLLTRKPKVELTQADLKWLAAVIAREGAPYKP